jgi:CheY-like chemotaxis protein
MASILIVDDDAAMRDVLSEAMRDLGYDVSLAASGVEAISLLDAQMIDAVLLDLRMPGMDGIEVLKRIRSLPNPPPVTVLTAHATAANTIEAMRLGAFDHLTKPIGRERVSRVLAGMLAARVAPSALRQAPEAGGLIGSSESMRAVQKAIGARRQQRHRAHLGRNGNRQGIGGARHSRARPSQRQAIRPDQLCGYSPRTHGKTVRAYSRRVHGRRGRSERRVSRGRAWHAVS